MKAAGQTAGQTRDAGGTLLLEALRGAVPAVSVADSPRGVVDLEPVLHWAVGQSSYQPWRGVNDRELMLDGGYTVIPKGCDRRYRSRGVLLVRPVSKDAATVLAALDALDVWTRSIVTANAKARRRPDWMEGIEPRLVEQSMSWRMVSRCSKSRRRRRRGHRASTVMVWENGISPETIRACREIYSRWHAGMTRLAELLDGTFSGFQIKGFAAPATPWAEAGEETA